MLKKKFQKHERYYHVYTQLTFFENEIDLICTWGTFDSRRGGNKIITCKSEEEIKKKLKEITKRRAARGYAEY